MRPERSTTATQTIYRYEEPVMIMAHYQWNLGLKSASNVGLQQ